jgi:hypothetical protein
MPQLAHSGSRALVVVDVIARQVYRGVTRGRMMALLGAEYFFPKPLVASDNQPWARRSAVYQILLLMPDGELLVGQGEKINLADDLLLMGDEWHLNVHFEQGSGELVIQGNNARLKIDDLTAFEAHNVSLGMSSIADRADGGRCECVYRGATDNGPIAIGIAFDTDRANDDNTSWLAQRLADLSDNDRRAIATPPPAVENLSPNKDAAIAMSSESHSPSLVPPGIASTRRSGIRDRLIAGAVIAIFGLLAYAALFHNPEGIEEGSPAHDAYIKERVALCVQESLADDLKRSREELPVLPTRAETERRCEGVVRWTDHLHPGARYDPR